jgi:hypothetical protein
MLADAWRERNLASDACPTLTFDRAHIAYALIERIAAHAPPYRSTAARIELRRVVLGPRRDKASPRQNDVFDVKHALPRGQPTASLALGLIHRQHELASLLQQDDERARGHHEELLRFATQPQSVTADRRRLARGCERKSCAACSGEPARAWREQVRRGQAKRRGGGRGGSGCGRAQK